MTEPRRIGCGWNGLRWAVALIGTLATLAYQDRTGPTYPLRGSFRAEHGMVRYTILRSETIGTDLALMLHAPVPDGVSGEVRYRRFRSHDEWRTVPMRPDTFSFEQRGRTTRVQGVGVRLPSLEERAGKYEFFVDLIDGGRPPVSITGDRPIYARYKAHVPGWALVLHIATIFGSFLLVIRTVIEALLGGRTKRLLGASVVTLLIGGFVLGPVVQWYAFGVWWSGFPFGYDWTDNKVVVELAAWLAALWANRGARNNRWAILLAGVLTLAVYFIPHSIFGSEYNYVTGSGHGTAG